MPFSVVWCEVVVEWCRFVWCVIQFDKVMWCVLVWCSCGVGGFTWCVIPFGKVMWRSLVWCGRGVWSDEFVEWRFEACSSVMCCVA